MYEYNNELFRLPSVTFPTFKQCSSVQYKTGKKKSFYLPKIRTNYGKFNIRFHGVKSLEIQFLITWKTNHCQLSRDI